MDQVNAIFCYTFRDITPADPIMGGFSINLYENDCLVYNTYDAKMHINGEKAFMVGPEVRARIMNQVAYGEPWLKHMPGRIAWSDHPQTECSFGFCGYSIFRLEDMEQLVSLPFRSRRGHYARQVYSLFENVAAVLGTYGLELMPDGFSWNWDANVIGGGMSMQA